MYTYILGVHSQTITTIDLKNTIEYSLLTYSYKIEVCVYSLFFLVSVLANYNYSRS